MNGQRQVSIWNCVLAFFCVPLFYAENIKWPNPLQSANISSPFPSFLPFFLMKITISFLGLAAAIASVQAAPTTPTGLASAPIAEPQTYTLPVQVNPNFSRSAKASVWKAANKYKKFGQSQHGSFLAGIGSVNMTDVQNDVEVSSGY